MRSWYDISMSMLVIDSTRIDECLTAREEAEQAGLREIAELLAAAETPRRGAP